MGNKKWLVIVGVLIYAFLGSALITFLGLTAGEEYKGPSFVSSFVYGLVATAMLVFFFRTAARNLWKKTAFFFLGCWVSPFIAVWGALFSFIFAVIVLFILAGVFGIEVPEIIVVSLLVGASVAGGLSLLIPLHLFRKDLLMPKYFRLVWVVFCIIYPFLLIPFVDLKPFEGLMGENGPTEITDIVFLAKVFFPWQMGTLFMLGIYFSGIFNIPRTADDSEGIIEKEVTKKES